MKGEPPVFYVPSYILKAIKSRVRTGEKIHFVENEVLTCDFTISQFISSVFTISP